MSDRARLGAPSILGIVLGVVVLSAVLLYAFDYGVEATVVEKDCSASPRVVIVETKRFGIDHTEEVGPLECAAISRGNFVVYHIRSARIQVYRVQGGDAIYDSDVGLV